MPTPSNPEYVYLIGSRKFGWYKIGKAKRPSLRVAQLGILLPFKIAVFGLWATSRGLETERLMHEKYSAHSINGEWFSIDLEAVVGILRDEQPSDSLLVYSAFDPNTYANADKLGIRADFSNMERDQTVVSKGISRAKNKIKVDHAHQWLERYGHVFSQENWTRFRCEIHKDFKAQYGGYTDEQLAAFGGYMV